MPMSKQQIEGIKKDIANDNANNRYVIVCEESNGDGVDQFWHFAKTPEEIREWLKIWEENHHHWCRRWQIYKVDSIISDYRLD